MAAPTTTASASSTTRPVTVAVETACASRPLGNATKNERASRTAQLACLENVWILDISDHSTERMSREWSRPKCGDYYIRDWSDIYGGWIEISRRQRLN